MVDSFVVLSPEILKTDRSRFLLTIYKVLFLTFHMIINHLICSQYTICPYSCLTVFPVSYNCFLYFPGRQTHSETPG